MLFSINVWYTSLRSKSVHCLVTSFTMNGFRNFTYMCAFSNGNPRLKKLINASTIGHDSMGSFKITSSGKTMMSNSLNADKRWRMDCICAELDFLFIAHIPSLTFLCRGGILRGVVLLVLPVALLLCETHKKQHARTLFFSRALSLSSKALFRAR